MLSMIRFLFKLKPPIVCPGHGAQAIGQWGEQWAAWYYLKMRNAVVLEKNHVGTAGEIDLILSEKDLIVFAEVKTRSDKDPEPDLKAIVSKQREHLQRAAREYYEQLPPLRPFPRFDLVLVQYDRNFKTEPTIIVMTNTMEPVNLR